MSVALTCSLNKNLKMMRCAITQGTSSSLMAITEAMLSDTRRTHATISGVPLLRAKGYRRDTESFFYI